MTCLDGTKLAAENSKREAVEKADASVKAMEDFTSLYLDDLCVDEACRGMHTGGTLYRAVLDLARSLGCYNVTLNVWSCNPEAMRFYEKCGLQTQRIGMEVIL